MKKKIIIINGPNLNMLGKRDSNIYGNINYKELVKTLKNYSKEKNHFKLKIFQSNSESKIINCLHELCNSNIVGIIINAGAFTHYSYAIRDALEIITNVPKIEVHLSNVDNREEFRKKSVFDGVVDKKFYGKQIDSYIDALNFLDEHIKG